MTRAPSFEVRTRADADPGDVLLLGAADVGAASLTVVDYLVDHLETTRIGHVRVRNLPTATPVVDGRPRRPMRLYAVANAPISILVSEVFVPVGVAEAFADAVFEWAAANDVDEIGVVHGAAYPHEETDHRAFRVGTASFRRTHFEDGGADVEALPGGVLEGVPGAILAGGLDRDEDEPESEPPDSGADDERGPRTAAGVFVTPTHPPGPDLTAALELLAALEACYPIDVDEAELRTRSAERTRYYEELADRLRTLEEEQRSLERRDVPEDRMYM